ncbi:MAG: hypothetical protein ACLGIR_01590 [Actinomycetes bacterium]
MDRHAERIGHARPSSHASSRLSTEVTREVADLRVRLHEAVLRSDAFLLAGQPEAAAEVLAEQHVLLARFQDRLAEAAAAAKVEHEAEQVLAPTLALLRHDERMGADAAERPDPGVPTLPTPSEPAWSSAAPDRHGARPDRAPALVASVLVALALLGLSTVAEPPSDGEVRSAGEVDALPAGEATDDVAAGGLAHAAERAGESLLAALAAEPTDDPTITTEWRRLVALQTRPDVPAPAPADPGLVDAIVGPVVETVSGAIEEVTRRADEQAAAADDPEAGAGTDSSGEPRTPAGSDGGGTDEATRVGDQSDTGATGGGAGGTTPPAGGSGVDLPEGGLTGGAASPSQGDVGASASVDDTEARQR